MTESKSSMTLTVDFAAYHQGQIDHLMDRLKVARRRAWSMDESGLHSEAEITAAFEEVRRLLGKLKFHRTRLSKLARA